MENIVLRCCCRSFEKDKGSRWTEAMELCSNEPSIERAAREMLAVMVRENLRFFEARKALKRVEEMLEWAVLPSGLGGDSEAGQYLSGR